MTGLNGSRPPLQVPPFDIGNRAAALSWGRDWTTTAQGLSGLIVPGVHP